MIILLAECRGLYPRAPHPTRRTHTEYCTPLMRPPVVARLGSARHLGHSRLQLHPLQITRAIAVDLLGGPVPRWPTFHPLWCRANRRSKVPHPPLRLAAARSAASKCCAARGSGAPRSDDDRHVASIAAICGTAHHNGSRTRKTTLSSARSDASAHAARAGCGSRLSSVAAKKRGLAHRRSVNAQAIDLGITVEVPGIEPGSSVASSGLLRAQSATPLLGSTGHADQPV